MDIRVKRRSVTILGAILLVSSLILLASVSLIVPVQAVTQESPYVYGDANRDGSLTSTDFIFAKLMYLEKMAFVPSADANMDGKITSTDFIFAKLMYLEKMAFVTRYEATYNFSTRAGTSRIAMWKNVDALPSDNFSGEAGWTEATSSQYTSLSAEDGNVWTIAGSAGLYTALQCKFTVGEGANASDITSIGVTLNGSSETEGDLLQFWAWNFDTTSWTQVGSDISMTTSPVTYTAWSAWGTVYADYINAENYMYILLIHNTLDKDLNVDYVELAISTPTECLVAPDDTPPAAVTDLAATGFTTTSVTLSWTAPADDGSDPESGPATSYDIRYSTSNITEANWGAATPCTGEPAPGTPGATDTFTVTGLTTGQPYYFALKTADEIPNWSGLSNVISETPQHPTLQPGDWWLNHVYYDSEEGEVNSVYEIWNVRVVDQTAYLNYSEYDNPGAGFTDYTLDNCAIIDWNMDESLVGGDCTEPTRERHLPTGLSGLIVPSDADNNMQDAELYVPEYDSSMWVRLNGIPRAFSTTLGMGDADLPSTYYMSFQDSAVPATTSNPPGPDDGHPFEVGEADWPQWSWLRADLGYTTLGGASEQEHGFLWHVDSTISGYDVGAECEAAAATGVFDVTLVTVENTYWATYSFGMATGHAPPDEEVPIDPDLSKCWYSESVKNCVRWYDASVSGYYGYEDRGIVQYETRTFGKSDLVVSDQTGDIDVSITITNTLPSTANFSILLLIMDMDAYTADCPGGNHQDYVNGKTVFPDISDITSIHSAIQATGSLAPGASTTVTWTNVYTSDLGPYTVWCQGLSESW